MFIPKSHVWPEAPPPPSQNRYPQIPTKFELKLCLPHAGGGGGPPPTPQGGASSGLDLGWHRVDQLRVLGDQVLCGTRTQED